MEKCSCPEEYQDCPVHAGKPADSRPARVRILEDGKTITQGDRNRDYGSPVPNMRETAELWDAYLKSRGVRLWREGAHAAFSGEDVANMMALMKLARTGVRHKEDNYVDAAVYLAIAGECSEAERGS